MCYDLKNTLWVSIFENKVIFRWIGAGNWCASVSNLNEINLQKLINFFVTLDTKSPISITTEHQFSYTCHKLSMYLAYSLCTPVKLNASDFSPCLFWQMDFTISICGFTSESLEFNCPSCSSTNLTSEIHSKQ